MNGSQFYVTTGESLDSLDEKVGWVGGWVGQGKWANQVTCRQPGCVGTIRAMCCARVGWDAACTPSCPPPTHPRTRCPPPTPLQHTIFGEVAEGLDVLEAINEAPCDAEGRPLQVRHVCVYVRV